MSKNEFPESLFEFTRRFATEEACWSYLVYLRWPDGTAKHPETGEPAKYFTAPRKLWQFADGYQMSATTGTVMERTKVPLTQWFWAAYLIATHTPGVSALQLSRQLGARYETVYMMLQKLRAGLVDPDRTMLTGTVEIDESYIGGRQRGVRGRGAAGKALVVGAVESVPYKGRPGKPSSRGGRVRLRLIPNAGANALGRFISDNIQPGSTVRTDGWASYPSVTTAYTHEIVEAEDSVEVAKQLIHIHRVFSNLKTWLMGTHHGVSPKHLQAYLNEYCFRFNRRFNPFQAFRAALGISVRVEGPEYEDIYDAGEPGAWKHSNPKPRKTP